MQRADEIRLKQPAVWTKAHVMPFVVFMGFNLVYQVLAETSFAWDHPSAPWFRRWPEQWMYPLQTVVCLFLLVRSWRCYEFRWDLKWCAVGVVFGAVGIGFWLLPTTMYDRLGLTADPEGWMKWMGVAGRKKGFDPGVFESAGAYWASCVMRFLRAAVVVALIEEILWRGFIMRFVNDWEGDYWKQPFGRHTWVAYGVSTLLFTLAHGRLDYLGAVVYGTLTYVLCVWSKNLGACVVMHGTANLLMGIYALQYGKYGLW